MQLDESIANLIAGVKSHSYKNQVEFIGGHVPPKILQ